MTSHPPRVSSPARAPQLRSRRSSRREGVAPLRAVKRDRAYTVLTSTSTWSFPVTGHLAQLATQDLSAGGLGQGSHELHQSRVLIGRHPLLAELSQLVLAHMCSAFEGDERLDGFAPVGVRYTDHGGLGDGRVLVE